MQTIGERLEEGRKRKGISIREAAEATKIRGDYLQKFENNQFDIGLTDIYVRGFLRNYATFLKLPADRMLSDFASLGRGEGRPRQPSREIYGRMDVSVASADEPAERPAGDPSPGNEPARAARVPRSPGGNLPSLPSINPNLVFKGGIAVAGLVALLVVIWIGKSIFGGGGNSSTPDRTAAPLASAPAPLSDGERTFILVPIGPVQVSVNAKNADGTAGEELYNGTLAPGQTQAVPWNGDVYITADHAENLTIKSSPTGKAWPVGQTGRKTMRLPGPTK